MLHKKQVSMPVIEVSWLDDEQTIILFDFLDSFELKDYIEAVKVSRKMLNESTPDSFSVIADVSKLKLLPIHMISALRHEYSKPAPNFSGVTILVGAPRFIIRLVHIFQSAFKMSQFILVDTREDAHTYILNLD